jgi:hypothetical protein
MYILIEPFYEIAEGICGMDCKLPAMYNLFRSFGMGLKNCPEKILYFYPEFLETF